MSSVGRADSLAAAEVASITSVTPATPVPATSAALRRSSALIGVGDIVALAFTALCAGASIRSWIVATILAAGLFGTDSQRLRRNLSALSDAPWLSRRLAVASLISIPVTLGADDRLLLQLLLSPVVVLLARAATYAVIRARRSRGRLVEPALVVGSGETSRRIVEALERDRRYGLWVVGVIDDVAGENGEPVDQPAILTGLDDLPGLVEALDIRHVIVSPCVGHGTTRAPALRATIERGVDVHVIPRMGEVLPQPNTSEVDIVAGYALHHLGRPIPSGPGWWTKRVIDVLGASLVLLIMAPVLVAAAIGVKLTSSGPILFRQPRIGRGGRQFTMLKFRTYPVDHADTVFSLPIDACPIPFGRVLRRTSIDELPQLLNVLRGDMSLVGPRPERPHFAETLADQVPGYMDRHRVRGGITGLAQVHGFWGDSSIYERVRLDNRYIDSWSLWRDLVIIALTIPASIRKYSS